MKPILGRLAIAASVATLLLVGCDRADPDALVASARSYLDKHDERAAIIQLRSALQKQPDQAEARFLLGRTLVDRGDAAAGEVELRKALALKYPISAVAPSLVRALVLQGQATRAIQDYGATEFDQPAAMAELKIALAGAYVQVGDQSSAQAAVNDALRAVPGSARALVMQARVKASGKDVDGALASLDEVIAKDPSDYEALQLKGDVIYLLRGDADASIALHRRALSARANWLPSHVSIIEVLLARKDLPGAREQLEQLKLQLPNHVQTRYYDARIAYQGHDDKTAREKAQLLLAAAPEDPRALMLAGSIELHMGSLPKAESYAEKALQHAPDSLGARRLLAQVQLRSGEPQKARETLQPLLDRRQVDVQTLNLAAEAALLLGDAAGSEAYFARAAKLDPNDVKSRTALALAEFSRGKSEPALAQLQEIAAADRGTLADMALISARMRQRDFDGALKAIDSLEAKQADKPLAAHLRGQVQLARQDVPAARASFAKALAIDPLYFPAAANLAALDLRDHKPDEARKRFENQLAIDPSNVRALLAVADLRAAAGAPRQEVLALVEKAVRANPTAPAARAALVNLHLRANDPRAALLAAQDAVTAFPENVELLDLLGQAQLASGDAAQALATFNNVVSLRRTSPQALLRVADTQMALHNTDAARKSVNRALAIAPGFLPAQRGLILVEMAAGNPDRAMEIARAIQREHPAENTGFLYAGDIEASRKNLDAAAAAYRAGLARSPSSELATRLHGTLIAAKRRDQADSFATDWLAKHPQDAAFVSYLGDAAVAQRDFVTAEAHYLAFTKLQPDSAVAFNNLAWVAHQLKKPEAMTYAEKANALQPDQPDILDTLATVLADQGNAAKALEIEKKALALRPDSAPLRLNLAKIYLKTGDKAQARTELLALEKLGDKFEGHAEVGELLKTL